MAEDLKEKILTFEDKIEKNFKDKKLWECMTGEGGKFTCWDQNIATAIVVGEEVKVRYEIKKSEKYTNFFIKAVANKKEDDSWGEWIEGAKGKGGFKAFDSEGANKRTCLQAASVIVAAQMGKTSVTNPVASVLDITAKLMAGVFGAGKAIPEASGPTKPVVTPVKKSIPSITEALDQVSEEQEVPF